ncbi:MAG: hypothetical protein KF832_20960 [Caldilineaceae bacterium]|nr:hypothetical protein [Caldilineaceae bacterium]
MSVLFFLVVLPLVALILLLLGAVWLTNVLANRLVGNTHRLLEEIVNHGEIPQQWRAGWRNRRWGGQAPQPARVYQRALRKLDELLHYARTTALIADEESRAVLVERLTEVRAEWQRRMLEYG